LQKGLGMERLQQRLKPIAILQWMVKRKLPTDLGREIEVKKNAM